MADIGFHQSLTQQQALAPQMRRSLEILQAGTAELSQILNQALEANPVLEEVADSVSLDAWEMDEEDGDSLARLNETDDDWRERAIVEGRFRQDTADDEARRQRLYESIVAPLTLQGHLLRQLETAMVDDAVPEIATAHGSTCCGAHLSTDVADAGLRARMAAAMLAGVADGAVIAVANRRCACWLATVAQGRVQVGVPGDDGPSDDESA